MFSVFGSTPAPPSTSSSSLEFDSDIDSDMDDGMGTDWELVSGSDFEHQTRQPEFEPLSPFADCIAAQTNVGAIVDDDTVEQKTRNYENSNDDLNECQDEINELQVPSIVTMEPNRSTNMASDPCYSTMWSPVTTSCAHLFTLLSVSVVLCHTVERTMPAGFFTNSNNVVANVTMPFPVNVTQPLEVYNVDVAPASLDNTIKVTLDHTVNVPYLKQVQDQAATIVFTTDASRSVSIQAVEPQTIRVATSNQSQAVHVMATSFSEVPMPKPALINIIKAASPVLVVQQLQEKKKQPASRKPASRKPAIKKPAIKKPASIPICFSGCHAKCANNCDADCGTNGVCKDSCLTSCIPSCRSTCYATMPRITEYVKNDNRACLTQCESAKALPILCDSWCSK